MNYIKEYVEKIESGEIVVGKKIKKIYKKLLKESSNESLPFYFDEEKGNRPINFIETFCKQAEGEIGKPIKLELFQKAYIQALFGFIYRDTGLRRFNETMFLVGRKNGKTTMLSAIALYMMIADGEGSAECYSVATKKDQASKAFKSACAMRAQSPEIRAIVNKRRSDMYMPTTFSSFEPLSSDSDTLDGLNAHLVIIDELHAIKDRNLYDVMKQSTSSRRQPLVVMITTAGTVRECIFDDIYNYANNVLDEIVKDDSFLPVLYELDKTEEWKDISCWAKANPGLGTIKQYKYLAKQVERAKNDTSSKRSTLCKDFNIRSNSEEKWLDFDTVNNEEKFDIEELRGTYAIGGADLSSTLDLTCATLIVLKKGKIYVLQQYFIPEDTIEEKENDDKVPYKIWKERGLLTTCPGAKINYTAVTEWFIKMHYEYDISPLWIGYDRWGSTYWVDEMKENGFQIEQVIQGAQTMSNPMKQLEADLKEKKVVYNNNPILKWCLLNTAIEIDKNDNIRPVKGKKSKERIDGTVSLIDAYVVLYRKMQDYLVLQEE
jgi:phage terminase large subunit-like protein|nr:MAG TPA: Large Terminase [Caudoviricetes sp.]